MISITHNSAYKIRSRINKITSKNIRLLMQNEVNNWQYIGFFILIYKRQYRLAVPFTRSQKSLYNYIVSKSLSGLETFHNNL